MNRKKIAFIYLPIIAVIPVIVGVYQILDFYDWLFEWGLNLDMFSWTFNFTPVVLILIFIISLYEKFCFHYRMVLLMSILIKTESCFWINNPESSTILLHNMVNISAVFIMQVSIVYCLIHFIIQIKDFIRYVRTRTK